MLNKSLWISFFVAIFAALLLRTYVFSVSYMPTMSMLPTLYPDDYVVLNHFVYREHLPQKGDVIVYTTKDDPGIFFVKRVIAVGGDMVEIKNGIVIVNEEEAEYGKIETTSLRLEKLPHSSSWHWIFWATDKSLKLSRYAVPDGSFFVMADRRIDTPDRRLWDTVPATRVKARVERVLFSTHEGFQWSRVLKSVD